MIFFWWCSSQLLVGGGEYIGIIVVYNFSWKWYQLHLVDFLARISPSAFSSLLHYYIIISDIISCTLALHKAYRVYYSDKKQGKRSQLRSRERSADHQSCLSMTNPFRHASVTPTPTDWEKIRGRAMCTHIHFLVARVPLLWSHFYCHYYRFSFYLYTDFIVIIAVKLGRGIMYLCTGKVYTRSQIRNVLHVIVAVCSLNQWNDDAMSEQKLFLF